MVEVLTFLGPNTALYSGEETKEGKNETKVTVRTGGFVVMGHAACTVGCDRGGVIPFDTQGGNIGIIAVVIIRSLPTVPVNLG